MVAGFRSIPSRPQNCRYRDGHKASYEHFTADSIDGATLERLLAQAGWKAMESPGCAWQFRIFSGVAKGISVRFVVPMLSGRTNLCAGAAFWGYVRFGIEAFMQQVR